MKGSAFDWVMVLMVIAGFLIVGNYLVDQDLQKQCLDEGGQYFRVACVQKERTSEVRGDKYFINETEGFTSFCKFDDGTIRQAIFQKWGSSLWDVVYMGECVE